MALPPTGVLRPPNNDPGDVFCAAAVAPSDPRGELCAGVVNENAGVVNENGWPIAGCVAAGRVTSGARAD